MGFTPNLSSALAKKRVVGLLLFAAILALFFALNRFPKLDAVGGDLAAVTAPGVQCFQGFCIERAPGTTFLSRWWSFSVTYFRLVAVGMAFAFVVAGLAEAFLFPSGTGRSFASRSMFKRTVKGAAVGPVMNLCSACIVPLSVALRRRGGGIEGAIAMVQGSATMNVPALVMVFFVFTPLLGLSRLLLALVGALVIGPIVALAVRGQRGESLDTKDLVAPPGEAQASDWLPTLAEAFSEWAKATIGYMVRLGPIMVAAGFASGLAIQWLSQEHVSEYLGNDIRGVAIAATFGLAINVPLLFEIPLVALLLLLGMGTAPAATLLFTAAAGGPVTFWGLSKVMPKRAIATFVAASWLVGLVGGLAVLATVGGIHALSTSRTLFDGFTDQSPSVAQPPIFTDVSVSAGVDFLHRERITDLLPLGGGAVILDFNSDGFQDIYVVSSDGANALYRNNAEGTFTDVAAAAGVDDWKGWGNGGCASDYDNDGHQDLYVTNYGPNRLFRNNGDGTFTGATSDAGVDDPDTERRSLGCAWGDYDRDGYLDLIVVHHLDEWGAPKYLETRSFESVVGVLVLFHNNGDGTFTKVTELLAGDAASTIGIHGKPLGIFRLHPPSLWGAGYQPGWVDFDNDGDLDLYVVNDFGREIQPNVMWRNDGASADGTWRFVDVSVDSRSDVDIFGMSLAIGDYDLDGYFDFYMTDIGDNVLLKSNGDGLTFTDATAEADVGAGSIGTKVRVSWGAFFFDYDNDGDEDLYVVSGHLKGGIAANPDAQPNVLLNNSGNGTFTDISTMSGADDQGVGRGGAYLDFNNDGCLDIFVVNLGQRAKLFRGNCDSANNWLAIRTVGSKSNRDGIGARVTVVAGNRTQIREISAGGSSVGQNTLVAHLGFGQIARVDSVTIEWPSGKVETLTDVAVNRQLTITEQQ